MKNLNESLKIKINALIDNELDEEKKYEIEKIIKNDEDARKFYDDMLETKNFVSMQYEIKASADFEKNLFAKIHSLPQPKKKFAFINKLIDLITLPRLSYAAGTLLFLFFFGFAVYRLGKNSVVNPAMKSDVNITDKSAPEIFKSNPTDANISMRGNSKGFSDIPQNQPERKSDLNLAENKSAKSKRVSKSINRKAIAKETETLNQKRTRRLFDKYERNNGVNKENSIVKHNYNKGVDQFLKGNYSVSKKHFLLVVQKANRNSYHYRYARKFLQKMVNRK